MPQNIMQIQELLKGYIVDRNNIQSVGNMTVIPITSDVEFTDVANVNEVVFSRDPEYNRLEFKNQSGKIGIALQGWAIINDKQTAQDRTLPYAHLIKAANSKVIPANCIQRTQGGHFDPKQWSQDDFMVMPPSLRGIALDKSTYTASETGALWDSLSRWTKTTDCGTAGLQSFYSKFQDKLDQFVAQFEPVDKQLGAIVLINDVVVAIDIMPKYDSWKSVWRALVRDSYGAEALRVKEEAGAVVSGTSFDMSEVDSMEALETQYNSMKTNFYDSLQHKVGEVTQLSIGYQSLEKIDELTMLKLEGDKFLGQGVLHGSDHFIYLSLVNIQAQPKAKAKDFQSLRQNPYHNTDFRFRG